MKTVLCHYVQMDKYEVPNHIVKLGYKAIENYIFAQKLTPVTGESRDWEIVDVINN